MSRCNHSGLLHSCTFHFWSCFKPDDESQNQGPETNLKMGARIKGCIEELRRLEDEPIGAAQWKPLWNMTISWCISWVLLSSSVSKFHGICEYVIYYHCLVAANSVRWEVLSFFSFFLGNSESNTGQKVVLRILSLTSGHTPKAHTLLGMI